MNEVVRQRGRNTRSELGYNGVLEDAAKKSLRTTIDLVHGAKGAQGNEAETVLVLGDDVVVNKTLPTILCDEDDVAGNQRRHHRLGEPRAAGVSRQPWPLPRGRGGPLRAGRLRGRPHARPPATRPAPLWRALARP